ncbi:MAG: carbohydrate porin [Planctomycetes bacterium]|jgi:carbohydrate-selective porin OprB|nr:carbohydrate porin [Planctomycetota bacterium]
MRRQLSATTLLHLTLATPLLSQDDATPDLTQREWIGGLPFTSWTHLTGDWGGFRNQLEAIGIEVAGGYTADLAAPWSGDGRRRASLQSLLDLNAAFDLETIAGLPRTIAYFDAYRIDGRNPSLDVGDFQVISNIANADLEQIAEVWVETWLGDQFRLKVGKVDFNSEFSFHEVGGEFVNSTAAISPAIIAYPTFPNPATSVNLFWVPNERWYVGAAIYDGANGDGIQTGSRGPSGFFSDDESDAYFYAAEVGYAWTGGERWGSGRISVGTFYHSASFDRFDGGSDRGTAGAWFNLEQRFWRENPGADDGQGASFFVGTGHADDTVSVCGSSFAAGLEWMGALPSRDFDVLGLGLFHADMSDAQGAGTPDDETTIELFYKVQLTPSISLKPELQHVMNPGGFADVDDVLVGLLRLEVAF